MFGTSDITLDLLREWLCSAAQQGRSKATLARRSASTRGGRGDLLLGVSAIAFVVFR